MAKIPKTIAARPDRFFVKYRIATTNIHHHWGAGDDDFAEDTLRSICAWAAAARPCESSAWCRNRDI
jgi:hypothetical protein